MRQLLPSRLTSVPSPGAMIEMPAYELTVSVALCTHNGEDFIAEQLRSILGQSQPPREIILSDDASSDSTVDVARREFEDVRSRRPELDIEFRLIRNSSALGVTKNFEQAVREAKCELIALSDQDDVWRSNRLQLMVSRFEADPELLLLFGDARLVDTEGAPLGSTVFDAIAVSRWERETLRAGRAFDVLLRRNIAVGATTVFRRSLLAFALPFPRSWVHDEWLAVIAAAKGPGTVDSMLEPLIDYRQHGGNQIGARKLTLAGKARRIFEPRSERNERLVMAFEILRERLEELPVRESVRTKAREKSAHESVRNDLPKGRVRRIGPVLREVRTGRYALSGRGWPDVARDLLQPSR